MFSTKKYLWNNLETCRLIPCNTSFQKKKIYIDILDKLHKKITIRRNEDDWKSIVASSYHPIFIRVSHILLIHFHSCIEFVLNILTTQTWYIGDFFPLFSLAKLCVRKKKKFLCGRQRWRQRMWAHCIKKMKLGGDEDGNRQFISLPILCDIWKRS